MSEPSHPARALTEELRAIAEALAGSDLDPDRLARGAELARRLREELSGPPRARWYDADEDAMSLSRESRGAYLDQSPVRGRLNPVAPPLHVELARRDDGTPVVRGRARLGRAYEGPPHGVHGGWVAALFDDLLGATQTIAEAPGVTATLHVRYRAVTPIDEELRLEAWIERSSGRRILSRATCHAGDTLTAEAEGLFVRVDFNAVQEQMARRQRDRDDA